MRAPSRGHNGGLVAAIVCNGGGECYQRAECGKCRLRYRIDKKGGEQYRIADNHQHGAEAGSVHAAPPRSIKTARRHGSGKSSKAIRRPKCLPAIAEQY